jgi:tetratricopeptide (TPR) repeat protein
MKQMKTFCLMLVVMIWAASNLVAADSLEIYLRAGADHVAANAEAAALSDYQKALQLDPDNYIAIKNLGLIHAGLGNHDQARVFLDRAFKMKPTDAQVCNNLGVVYSELGNSAEAIRCFESATELDSTDAMYLTNLGQEYLKVGRVGQALQPLRAALALESENAIITYSLGNCFAASKSYDSAEYYYLRSATTGGRPAELYYRLGTVQRYLQKTEEATESFVEALTRQPEHSECRQALAMLLLNDGYYRQAAEHFDRLVAADSAFYPAWIGLGTAYALDGRSADSDRILSHLFSVDSSLGFRMLEVLRREQSKGN